MVHRDHNVIGGIQTLAETRTSQEPVVVDSQVHIWSWNTHERPWAPNGQSYVHRATPLTARELVAAMDSAGVHRAILVPPSWEGDRNDLVLKAVQDYPGRFAAMGRLAVNDRDNYRHMGRWLEQPGMLGIRLTFSRGEQRDWLTNGTVDWFWPAAEKAGIPVMVFAPGRADQLSLVAARHEGLRLVVDHVGLAANELDADLATLIRPVLELARYPNVAVKASGLPGLVSESYPFKSLHEPIHRVLDAFGPSRVFWGSDLSRLPCSYRDSVSLFSEALDFLSDHDRRWIMGKGVAQWLGWSLA
jgi:L-fuconolactonase